MVETERNLFLLIAAAHGHPGRLGNCRQRRQGLLAHCHTLPRCQNPGVLESRRVMESLLFPSSLPTGHEPESGRSAGVLACEFSGRPAPGGSGLAVRWNERRIWSAPAERSGDGALASGGAGADSSVTFSQAVGLHFWRHGLNRSS